MKCLICGWEGKNQRSISGHVVYCHSILANDYKDKFDLFKKCERCGKRLSENCKGKYCKGCIGDSEINKKECFIPMSPTFSYFLGLAQTDGSMTKSSRHRGKFQLELSYRDRHILKGVSKIIPCNYTICDRTRKIIKLNGRVYRNKKFSLLRVCDWGFRDFLEQCGVPYGKKSDIIKPPHLTNLFIPDYIRGLYDGDGSVGFTAQGLPFLSFCTKSELIKEFILQYVSDITGKPLRKINRQKRDNVYNIMIANQDSLTLGNALYYEGCVAISRKYKKARDILNNS